MVWRNIIELASENDLKYKDHMYEDTDATSDSQQLLEVRKTDINKQTGDELQPGPSFLLTWRREKHYNLQLQF